MQLLREGLKVSSKASRSLILLSLGICSIAFIWKRKRILYLHSLLKKDPSSLASKVFLQMIKKPLNSDWINIVKNDLKDFNMHQTFDQISNIPKEKFKAIVRDACKKPGFIYQGDEAQT